VSLVDKLRKAREARVLAGGHTFIVRRPTALELIEIQSQPRGRAILPFVIGWEGVKELDLIPGGDPHPLAFDADVCAEWLTDRLDLLGPVADGIFEECAKHVAALEAERKN